ncbi:hypothetical protein KL923_001059 [Ogataea haglerorum]|nr:hypothetical protein KL923_001059 [Ogataea haglerorum]
MTQPDSNNFPTGKSEQPSSAPEVYMSTHYAPGDLPNNYNPPALNHDSPPKVGIPPSEIRNPFLQNTSAHQGTFYVIFLPIVAGFVLAFLIGSAYHRFRAKSQAKDANSTEESFDSDCTEPLDEGGAVLEFLRDRSRPVANEKTNPRCSNSGTTSLAKNEKIYYQPLAEKQEVTTLQLRKLEICPITSPPFTPPQRPLRTKKAISSILLDGFIETGEIPAIVEPLVSNGTKKHISDLHLCYTKPSPSEASRTFQSSNSCSGSPDRHLLNSKNLSRSDKGVRNPSN